MSATPTGTASMSASASVAIVFSMIGGVSYLKVLVLGEESLYMGLHSGVGLLGRNELGGMLCGCGCTFVLANLEARHRLIHDGVGIVEDQFFYCSSSFSEFKLNFTEVMFKNFPCFLHLVGAFLRLDVFFEDSLPVEDNKGEIYCLTLI